jgi:hypothetical protein
MPHGSVPGPSRKILWTSWILSVLPSLLLLFSAAMKLLHPPGMDDGFKHLGVPLSQALSLGILEAACTLLYLVPRTAVLGAVLLTGYLGGAIQTHLRIGDPVYVHILLGLVIWGALYLREPRLRPLLPIHR